jgi:hypothetical protein
MNESSQPAANNPNDNQIPYTSAYFGCCNRTVMTRADIAQPTYCPFCGKALSEQPTPEQTDASVWTEHASHVEPHPDCHLCGKLSSTSSFPGQEKRCQERDEECGQCELRLGHSGKHLAGYKMWGEESLCERVEKLAVRAPEAEIHTYAGALAAEFARLREEMKEALRFYADPQVYGSVNRIISDAGKIARAALRSQGQDSKSVQGETK